MVINTKLSLISGDFLPPHVIFGGGGVICNSSDTCNPLYEYKCHTTLDLMLSKFPLINPI